MSELAPSTALPLRPGRSPLVGRRHAVEAAGRRSVVTETRRSEHVRPRPRQTTDVARHRRALRLRTDRGATPAAQGLQPAEVCRHSRTETEQPVRCQSRRRRKRNATAAAASTQTV